jgi:hypothetical protein
LRLYPGTGQIQDMCPVLCSKIRISRLQPGLNRWTICSGDPGTRKNIPLFIYIGEVQKIWNLTAKQNRCIIEDIYQARESLLSPIKFLAPKIFPIFLLTWNSQIF